LTGTGSDFSLGALPGSSTSATTTSGQAANYNLELDPVGGFSGTVALTCSGAPSAARCDVSTSTVNVNGTVPVNFVVSVSTSVASAAVAATSERFLLEGPKFNSYTWLLLSALCAVFATLANRRRSANAVRCASLACCGFVFAASISGCRSLGPDVNPPTSTPRTAPGTYTLTVTGTQQGVSRSLKLTLIVN